MLPDDKPNAPMTPREYVETIVLPTLRELLAARDDRRRAYLACLVVCHVADSLGLAEAGREPGFAEMQGRTRKRAVDTATEVVQAEAGRRCTEIWTVVHGFANGTKHPARLPLLPGTEESVPAFALDTPGAGFDGGRLDVPGLAVHTDAEVLFLDACAQQVLAAFVCAYPQHLGGIALSSFMDPGLPILGLDVERAWLPALAAWAAGRPKVAEVWLFGSRAKGTARPDSDVDLGLVLVPGEPGHDWPEGNYQALGDRWQAELIALMGRHVSLVAFGRPGEPQDDDIAAARAPAILLWTRPAPTTADPASLSTR
ncbi:nucleotidyltransferase domain-containing protein [Methylobacterium sp. J-088]|uniref:nucleotidyltransferase domain-containing protein n=1 Tax=Methylobacterium sp. J-088 TaxID=2836664 RepID=UPI001FB86EA6|nr:nucleotidyltransferase domain-containing protein [Methylobacterium sp. J-088]MCJ2065878.1 nucleotidyltransferase domain-containing protein [Methylobacterium sp. J-088]